MQSVIRAENNTSTTITVYQLCLACVCGILKNGVCNNPKCPSNA
ncbi:MAG: hypothetical protein AB1351_01840 [Thermoproteota archaeon]